MPSVSARHHRNDSSTGLVKTKAAIVLGPETRHGPLGSGVTARVAATAPSHVIVLHPEAGPLGGPTDHHEPADPAKLWSLSAT